METQKGCVMMLQPQPPHSPVFQAPPLYRVLANTPGASEQTSAAYRMESTRLGSQFGLFPSFPITCLDIGSGICWRFSF